MLNVESIDLYYGAAQALRSVSLGATPGRVTCVLGRNGVGKTLAAARHRRPAADPQRPHRLGWTGHLETTDPQPRRRGIAFVPQGREIFPLLTVKENLMTGFAPLARKLQTIPDEIFELFPVLKTMMGRRGGDLSGGQQQQLAIGRALVTRPKLLVLDEPTEGIQPSIIKDIGRAIDYLRAKGDMAIVLVEQYFEFARDLADDFAVMDRGAVVIAGKKADMVEQEVRARLSV